MNWGQCHRCGEYKINPHLCQCRRFLCWHDGDQANPDEAREIYAQDAPEAAEKMAYAWFREDWQADHLVIWVQPLDGGSPRPFLAEPEHQVVYHAREIVGEVAA